MGRVWLNGSLVDEEEASVSVFDHGLVAGDGVFESVAIRGGRPFALKRHLERIERSAAAVGLALPARAELEAAALAVAGDAALDSGKLRITVTAGLSGLGSARGKEQPTLFVAAERLGELPGEAAVLVAPWPRNERGVLAGAKTTSYAENVVALAWARGRGGDEALLLNTRGELCEGTGTNVFVGAGGRLLTPPLSSGCLAGVTRALVVAGAGAREEEVPAGALAEVDEAFLTSATRGVQPIVSIDGRPLPACPGPLTAAAGAALDEMVRSSAE